MKRLREVRQSIRYFFFPKSRLIDERTKQFDLDRQTFKAQKAITDQIVGNTNRPDVLRNLVIAMQKETFGSH